MGAPSNPRPGAQSTDRNGLAHPSAACILEVFETKPGLLYHPGIPGDGTVHGDDGLRSEGSAADSGYLEVVKFLAEKGADIIAANNNGRIPVHSAAGQGHIEVVKFLVEKGADITLADNNGWTSILTAAYSGYLQIVEELEAMPNERIS